jgi:hypothetical protein
MLRSPLVSGSVAAGFAFIEVGHPLIEQPKPATQPQYVTIYVPRQSDHSHGENHTPVNPCVGSAVQMSAQTAAIEYWSYGTQNYRTWRVVGG